MVMTRQDITNFVTELPSSDAFQAIKDTDLSPPELRYCIYVTVHHGKLRLLQNIVKHYSIVKANIQDGISLLVRTAIQYDHWHAAKYILETFKVNKDDFEDIDLLLNVAVEYSHFDELKWLVEYLKIQQDDVGQIDLILHTAVKHNRAAVFGWLINHFKVSNLIFRDIELLLYEAVENNCVDILRTVFEASCFDVSLFKTILMPAIQKGHLETVKILIDLNVSGNITDVFQTAAKFGQFHIIRWLYDHLEITKDCFNGNIGLVVQEAAVSGHLYIIKWMTVMFNIKKDDISTIIAEVLERGKLTTIQWLIIYYKLDENDLKNCFKDILRTAIDEHNYDMVKWTVKQFNLKKEDVGDVIRSAAFGQRLDIFQWLVIRLKIELTDFYNCYDVTIWHELAARGQLDVFKWMVDHFTIIKHDIYDIKLVYKVAKANNHEDFAEYVLEQFDLDTGFWSWLTWS